MVIRAFGGVGEGVVGAEEGEPETRLASALTSTTLYVPPVAGSKIVDADCVKNFSKSSTDRLGLS